MLAEQELGSKALNELKMSNRNLRVGRGAKNRIREQLRRVKAIRDGREED
jgi:hypothetical protein